VVQQRRQVVGRAELDFVLLEKINVGAPDPLQVFVGVRVVHVDPVNLLKGVENVVVLVIQTLYWNYLVGVLRDQNVGYTLQTLLLIIFDFTVFVE